MLRRGWLSYILAVLLTALGCSRSKTAATQGAPASDAGEFTLNVVSPGELTGVVTFWVAEELGFTKEEKLKFNYVGYVQSGQLVASVVAGKLDVGGAHVNRTIAGIAAGAHITAVAAASETTRATPHMSFIALKDSPIASPQDLLGKRVGLAAFGGCNEYTPYAYLMKHGENEPKGKFKISVVSSPAKLVQALEQGEVDLAGIHDNPDIILKKGKFKVLFTDYDVWETIGGATPYYFADKFIEAHPDVVRRFVRVIAKTNNWINANNQKAIEITARRGKVGTENMRAMFLAPDGFIKDDSIQVWIDLLARLKEIEPGIKPSQIYTNRFNDLVKG